MSEEKQLGLNFFKNFSKFADKEVAVAMDEFKDILKKVNLEHNKVVDYSATDVLDKISSLGHLIDQNRDIFDVFENWANITGLPQKELDAMDTTEVIALVREKVGPSKGKVLRKIPPTKHPKTFITHTDKVSRNLFLGELNEELQSLKMEGRGSKKELTTKVNINFDELENIKTSRDLSAYDQEVHDSIVSLYVDGGNEYITPLMVYRTLSGNIQAKLNPKQQETITESIYRCSFTRIRIDATGEAEAYGMDKAIYEGNLLYTEKVTVHHKGNVSEWIHLLREPILYEYASSKNQIGRLDIKLLDTPTNKNEETIILQGYLYRRILSMKGSPRLSRNIRYDTIYRHLGIPEESTPVIRNKKSDTRKSIACMLNYWKESNWIKGHDENKEGKTIASVTINI